MQEDQSGPPVPTAEVCYRHPEEKTRVHCTRCGRPICPACMIPAPVGHQCPECVAEARREYRQGPGRQIRRSQIGSPTRVLLVAILAMFIVELLTGGPGALLNGPSGQRLFDLGALQPLAVADGQYWRLFTSMFLHAGLLHIAFNAYALWLFGRLVEENFGRGRFLIIYFISGFVGGAASYAFGDFRSLGVGASGAIFGVFGAFLAYNYRRRHLAMAAANLRWAFTLILLNAFLAFTFRDIDWKAHLGGLVAGAIAGFIAEGVGPKGIRPIVQWAGYLALIAAGVALVVWRTSELRASLPAFFG